VGYGPFQTRIRCLSQFQFGDWNQFLLYLDDARGSAVHSPSQFARNVLRSLQFGTPGHPPPSVVLYAPDLKMGIRPRSRSTLHEPRSHEPTHPRRIVLRRVSSTEEARPDRRHRSQTISRLPHMAALPATRSRRWQALPVLPAPIRVLSHAITRHEVGSFKIPRVAAQLTWANSLLLESTSSPSICRKLRLQARRVWSTAFFTGIPRVAGGKVPRNSIFETRL
jgi:hypothetical protein